MNREDYIEEIREALIEEGMYDPEDSNPSELDLTEEEFNDLIEFYVDLAVAILEIAEDNHHNGEYTWLSLERIEQLILSGTWLEADQDEIGKICHYHNRWGNLERDARVHVLDDAQIYRYRPEPDSCLKRVIEMSDEFIENHEEEAMIWNKNFQEMCRKCTMDKIFCKLQKVL